MTQWMRVRSSILVSVRYDDENRVLGIEFTDGSVYEYVEVPAEVHISLMKAASLGAYYNGHIKGSYAFRRVR